MIGDGEGRLYIEGLREFAAGLRKAGGDLPKLLQRANKAFADTIAGKSRAAYGKFYTERTGKSAKTIRALASQVRAQVAIGNDKTRRGLLGQEFGSKQGPRKRQFPEYERSPSGKGGKGRFFYPVVREEVPEGMNQYRKMLDEALRPAFPDSF